MLKTVYDGREVPRTDTPRIVLVRHGETEWSRSGRHTSRTDVPLTASGEIQANAIGQLLRGQSFGLVLTSPRQRAACTAALAGYAGRATADENLAEWDYGPYEGLTSQQISEVTGQRWNLWQDGTSSGTTCGEQAGDVRKRAERLLESTAAVIDRGENVLVFSHAHFLRVLAVTWLELPTPAGAMLSLDTASVSTLGFEHGGRVLGRWNCTASILA